MKVIDEIQKKKHAQKETNVLQLVQIHALVVYTKKMNIKRLILPPFESRNYLR
jgi:hypothetical protein